MEHNHSYINRRSALKVGLFSAGVAVAHPTVNAAPIADAAPGRPSHVPKLDAMCSPAERAHRHASLVEARRTYVWSTKVENVEGVPMAAQVPVGDNPTVDWLIELVDNVLQLIENLVDSAIIAVAPQMKSATIGFSRQVRVLAAKFVDVVRDVDVLTKKYNNATLDTVVEFADKNAMSLYIGIITSILSELQKIRRSLFEQLEASLSKNKMWLGDVGSKDNLAKYNAMWASMPLPEGAHHLHDDSYFGYTRLAGPNPMVITRVRGALPDTLAVDEGEFKSRTGESVAHSIAAGRLYVCDYRDIGSLAKEDATYKVFTGPNYSSAPIAVFHRRVGANGLLPVAIQLGQSPEDSPVFYSPPSEKPTRSDYWGWQMARSVVQTADFNHHEMMSHLAWTHLVSEAFCMSVHRQLPVGHPLRTFLEPHFEGDLYINNLAAAIIMGPETIADLVLAPEIHSLQTAAGNARLKWNFRDKMPKRDFALRGVDDPALEFPYRDDALLIWDEIEKWVGDYVRVYYRDDAAVATDPDLRRFTEEVITKGSVKGFTHITSIDELIESLTMIVFTASAQHAAVNYLQRDAMAYAPFYSGTLMSLPKKPTDAYTSQDWFDMMPTILTSLAQMYFLNVLGSVYYRRLGDYRTNVFPYPKSVVDPRVTPLLAKFNKRLAKVEETITERNRKRRWAYPYLLPSNIPMSTNI